MELWIILNTFSDYLHIWNFCTKNSLHNNHLRIFVSWKLEKNTVNYLWWENSHYDHFLSEKVQTQYIIKLRNIGLIMKFMYNNNFIKFIMWYKKFIIIKSIEKSNVDIALCSSSHQSK